MSIWQSSRMAGGKKLMWDLWAGESAMLSRDEIKSNALAMLAFLEGKRVQMWRTDLKEWEDCPTPNWHIGVKYRVRPNVIYRPWYESEVPLGATVTSKAYGGRYLITGTDSKYAFLGGLGSVSLSDLYEKFVLENGREPCGKKI